MGVDEFVWSCLYCDSSDDENIDYNEMVAALMQYLESELNYSQMIDVLMCYLIN